MFATCLKHVLGGREKMVQTIQDTDKFQQTVCLPILGLRFCSLFMTTYILISLRLTQLVEL